MSQTAAMDSTPPASMPYIGTLKPHTGHGMNADMAKRVLTPEQKRRYTENQRLARRERRQRALDNAVGRLNPYATEWMTGPGREAVALDPDLRYAKPGQKPAPWQSRAGLPDGYSSKLLCGDKGFGQISMGRMMQALKCQLMLVPEGAELAKASGENSMFSSP
jgi:hypothetical protein